MQALWQNPYTRALIVVLAAVALLLLLRGTRVVWGSFFAAFLIAYLLSPLVARLERRGVHRGVAVAVAGVAFLGMVAGVAALATTIAAQVSTFADELPPLVETLQELPFMIARLVDPSFGAVFQQVFMSTQVLAQGLVDRVLPSVLGVGAEGLTRLLAGITSAAMQITIVMVLSLYLLYRYPVYGPSALKAVPGRHRDVVEELAEKASTSVGGFIRGQVLIAAVVGTLSGIGLTLLGVPLAIVLGALAAIFNVIPFFGPIVVAIPAAFLALTLSFGHMLGALLLLFLVNLIDSHLLTPIIYSRTIQIDPVTIVLSILTGAVLFGIVGAIAAVPAAAFLKLLYHDYYLSSRWYDRGAS